MNRKLILVLGLIILFAMEIGKVYFIMPFPGSQRANTINLAYFINKNIWWMRLIAIALIIIPVIGVFRTGKVWGKIALSIVLILYAGIFYLVNFKFLADKIFYQPKTKVLASLNDNKVSMGNLVVGVEFNGEAKAYPIEVIGYHHQVRDTVGGVPVMVTYCTVCRTGRVFSPEVNGANEQFRLVGMDHFNAMFEDSRTTSWWQQETGEAIAGPLKGTMLKELPSQQMRLSAWVRKYPNTKVLQPDTVFKKAYANLEGYDKGTIDGDLEHRDSASWKFKSWVVGVPVNNSARAYDWNDLLKYKVINDSISSASYVVCVEPDSVSFHVWNATVGGNRLNFTWDNSTQTLKDSNTGSSWNFDGLGIAGPLKDSVLKPVKAYQEFWHSWKHFHPETDSFSYTINK
ncbi:MAG: hypothetical protein C5B52_06805 [Bacteroidetes bacterium]|nr:MAG: hypothetical protein C5B52_06805 [Bacteroidota bacterium]